MTGLLVLSGVVLIVAAGVRLALNATRYAEVWPAAMLIVSAPLEVYRTNVGGFNLSAFRLALAVAALATAVDVRRRGPRHVAIPAAFVAYGALLAIQLVSLALVSTVPTLGYRFVSQYAAGLIAAAVIAWWMRRVPATVATTTFVGAAAVPILAGAWRLIAVHAGGAAALPGLTHLPVDATIAAARSGGSFLVDGRQRMVGTFGDPNHLAFFIAIAIAAGAGLLVAELAGPRRRLHVAATALALASGEIALLVTYSRSAWLLTGIALVVLVVLARRELGWLVATRLRIAGVVVLAVAALAAAAPLVIQRINPNNPGTRLSTETHGRTMRLAVHLLGDRPVTGVGIGSYGSYADQPALVSSAHSTILTVAAETGFPGVLSLLGAMLITVAAGIAATRRVAGGAERVARASLVAAFAGMSIANLVYEVWMDDFQWMLFGTVVAFSTQPVIVIGRHKRVQLADAPVLS